MAKYIDFEADVSSQSDENDLDQETYSCDRDFINDNVEQEDESFYYNFQNQTKKS